MSVSELLSVSVPTFSMIALAEVGDKSQLVCMTLAARHRHWPVIAGATLAFILLNGLAVVFGAGVAQWLPERVVSGIVAALFIGFGVLALRNQGLDDVETSPASGRSILATTFLLILVAEFGDKTQIAVAGLASSLDPLAVMAGATLALIATTILGVFVGRKLLLRMPVHWLHRGGGVIFLLFGLYALSRTLL